jgi:hypothetical protein
MEFKPNFTYTLPVFLNRWGVEVGWLGREVSQITIHLVEAKNVVTQKGFLHCNHKQKQNEH